MKICEIDVGLTGAVAIVDGQDVLFVDDMPVHQVASGKKLRAEVDLAALREMLCARPVDHVMLEQVAARPGQGTVSMFRFGYSAGAVAGIVAALQLPHSFLLPRAWQKAVGVGPSPDAARQRAAQLYPGAGPSLLRKRDAGRADALLIAAAGWRLLNQVPAGTRPTASGDEPG